MLIFRPGRASPGGAIGYVTGDLDIHEVAVAADGGVDFINSLFGCLATTSDRHSFIPLWQPPFLSQLAAEDRCHLNGLAMESGRPTYVSQSDAAHSCRNHRRDGGCVIDVRTDEIVATGLSMPPSPRSYRDRLWLLNSGTGHFGCIERTTGTFEPLVFCPGSLRGLTFSGDYVVVGLSPCRENRTFQGLEFDENLKSRDAEPQSGLCELDLKSGDLVHWL